LRNAALNLLLRCLIRGGADVRLSSHVVSAVAARSSISGRSEIHA
jgi:hypothetical protein